VEICAPSRSLGEHDRRRAASACVLFCQVKQLSAALAVLAILVEHKRITSEQVSNMLAQCATRATAMRDAVRRIEMGRLDSWYELDDCLDRIANALRRETRALECGEQSAVAAAAAAYVAGRRLGQSLWLLEMQPEGAHPTALARELFAPIGGWGHGHEHD
jgi:hypothetical protein